MSDSVSNEVAVASSGIRDDIQGLASGKASVFSTISGSDHAAKLETLKATTNSTPVSEHIDKTIKLSNVVIQAVDMADEKTGEVEAQPRIILIDADGTAYHAISSGLYKSIENIFGILGMPDSWPEPLPIKVKKIKGKQGHFFTAEIA